LWKENLYWEVGFLFKVSRKEWVVLLIILFFIVAFPFYLHFDGGKSNGGKSYKGIVMTFKIEKKE
jgi:hypothetical protein